jgi:ABC-type Mn2+/Zn2+ transport system permease subunit
VLVVPAATARLLWGTVRGIELGAFALALAEGLVGLWLAYELDVPPGPAIAVLSGGLFAVVAVVVAWRRHGGVG